MAKEVAVMEKKPRLIFHCDCNNFFASCEILERPELRDVPMAVAGDPENRLGVVVAKNELAKKCGVKTTDTVWQATKKCPGIVFVPPRHHYRTKKEGEIRNAHRFSGNSTGNRHFITLVSSGYTRAGQ